MAMWQQKLKEDYAELFYQHWIEENEKVISLIEAAIEEMKRQNRRALFRLSILILCSVIFTVAFIVYLIFGIA
jgi:hypothetical protein